MENHETMCFFELFKVFLWSNNNIYIWVKFIIRKGQYNIALLIGSQKDHE